MTLEDMTIETTIPTYPTTRRSSTIVGRWEMLRSALKIGGLMLALFLAPAATAAAADRINLDFETAPAIGTPIFNDYLAAGFVSFPRDPGYQPVRIDVGNRAHSGHIVLDASVGCCIDEGYPTASSPPVPPPAC
jgi:hypothetical protein